jgi:hypothetical protein
VRQRPDRQASPAPRQPSAQAPNSGTPTVDLVVPVYNEARVLATNIGRLHEYLRDHFPFTWRITIADNASTDDTWAIATHLAATLPDVRSVLVDHVGRGGALRGAWLSSDAAVVAYTDVDLSTDLSALVPLVAPLVSGDADVAIGSRLAPGAVVARGPKREVISRAYNLLLRLTFASRVRDAQCGFKALRVDTARDLLAAVDDDGWFFDTELLLLAEHNGLRITELPVVWVDDTDSRVHVVRTAIADLRGGARMAWRFATGRGRIVRSQPGATGLEDDFGRALATFACIGGLSTAASLGVFLALVGSLGPVGANAVAVTAMFLGNTWANWRYTVGAPVVDGHWLGALTVWLGSLAVTSAALGVVLAAGGGIAAQLVTLAVTWTAATLVRLVLVRTWMLRANR